jgi:tRNA threonylcarbamoyladenosine biosynthesis protein TsaE
MPWHLNLPDDDATLRLGEALAAGIAPGRVAHLRGDLGAGKTTVVRGLLRGLGYAGRVKSPTYTLLEPYELSSLHLYHFDFYRLEDPNEWLKAGFREYFNDASACVVEWPERAGRLLPPPDLDLHLEFAESERRATLEARSEDASGWLSSARQRLASK